MIDNRFVKTLVLADQNWTFDTRIVHCIDPRFEGKLMSGDQPSIDFTVIRLSTKRWFISGVGVPAIVQENAELIGAAFVRHCQ